MSSISSRLIVLFLGDALTLVLTTVFGFALHRTLGAAGERLLATYLPSLFAWLLVSPYLGVFDFARATDYRQLWRPVWAMILAAPLAAWLRGLWLNADIVPIFVIVLGGINALAILIWRGVYVLVASRVR